MELEALAEAVSEIAAAGATLVLISPQKIELNRELIGKFSRQDAETQRVSCLNEKFASFIDHHPRGIILMGKILLATIRQGLTLSACNHKCCNAFRVFLINRRGRRDRVDQS